jgi:hypothetical protein
MNLTPEQKGYIAGIIDGEGCFYYNPRKAPRKQNNAIKPRTHNPDISGFCPVLNISNTDVRLLNSIKKLIGGTIHHVKTKNDNWKDRYLLLVHANSLRKLLPQIVDLSIIKKEQIKLMLLWFETFSNRGFRQFNYERLELQNLFWKYSKFLNQKGNGKRGEFRGHLNNETILSQAFEEIQEKVQRLRVEAKDIGKNRTLDIIKNHKEVSRSRLFKLMSNYDRPNMDQILNDLINDGLVYMVVRKESRKPTSYYVYASNTCTSALDRNYTVSLTDSSCYDIVRATQ